MRLRFTLAFMFLALAITIITGSVRAAAIGEINRANALADLTDHARMIGQVTEMLPEGAAAPEPESLVPFVPDFTEATVQRTGSPVLTVGGRGFEAEGLRSSEDLLFVRETVGSTTVSLVEEAQVVRAQTREQQKTLLALLVFALLVSFVVGLVFATLLARPFKQLAAAAQDLGRGRYDIEPPASRIPEVASMSSSLRASADRLRDSMHRDREFFHHASHVLRTPLTGIRLELDQLACDEDVDEDVRRTADRCLHDVQRLDATVAELLHFARSRALVEGAEVPLLTFSAQVAQRWRDRLPVAREVKAFVDSGPDCVLTPGPVEQLLDSVLEDVAAHGTGAVSLHFRGQDDHVKISVHSGPRRAEAPADTGDTLVGSMVEALGGRCVGDPAAGGLEILLPRR